MRQATQNPICEIIKVESISHRPKGPTAAAPTSLQVIPSFGLEIGDPDLDELKNQMKSLKVRNTYTTVKPRFWNTFAAKILFINRFFAADQNL